MGPYQARIGAKYPHKAPLMAGESGSWFADRLSQRALAGRLGVGASRVVVLIYELEGEGLVVRTRRRTRPGRTPDPRQAAHQNREQTQPDT